jgi:hypothetical protein
MPTSTTRPRLRLKTTAEHLATATNRPPSKRSHTNLKPGFAASMHQPQRRAVARSFHVFLPSAELTGPRPVTRRGPESRRPLPVQDARRTQRCVNRVVQAHDIVSRGLSSPVRS